MLGRNMIEYERSYVFSETEAKLKFQGNFSTPIHIVDYYLDANHRIRHEIHDKMEATRHKEYWSVTKKIGSKQDGNRKEYEASISVDAAEHLIPLAKLVITKQRYDLSFLGSFPDIQFSVFLDFISSPMKIAILEIESKTHPVDASVCNLIFNEIFKECPLSAYQLFNRKIGICGGPSSGKSETAKLLSHKINTILDGNAFHVVEYATTFIQKYSRTPTFFDQLILWIGQKEREANTRANIVISDCPTFLNYIYALLADKPTASSQTVLYLSKLYKKALFDILSYDNIILLNIVKYSENNIRYQTYKEALAIEDNIRNFLVSHNIPYSSRTYFEIDKIICDLFYMNGNLT